MGLLMAAPEISFECALGQRQAQTVVIARWAFFDEAARR